MSDYTKTTNFAAKDSLPSGNSGKIVKGSEIDTEFTNIQTAVATKLDINNSALTGTTTAQTLDISGNVDVDGTLETDALSLNGVTVTSTAAELNYVDGVTSNIQTQLDTKAPLASPTFTGTVTVPGLTTTANVLFGDNDRAIFGAGSDLQIYHDGNDSYIQDSGTGLLFIRGSSSVRIQGANGESAIDVNENGAVNLYYDNSNKLSTTATGISVSGAVGAPSSENFYRIKFQDQGGTANDVGIGQPDADSLAFNFTPTSGGHIAFFAGSNEKVRIDSSGNVGIGTSSVTNALGWASVAQVGGANPALSLKNTSNVQWDIANFGGTFAVYNGSNQRLTIDSSGNVTVKAAAELRIRDDGSFIKEDQGLQIGNTSGTGATRPIRFFTESAERMRVDSGGGINKVSGSGATLPAIAAGLLAGEFKGSADSAVTNDSGFLRLSAGGGTTVGVKAGIDIFRGSTDGSLIRMFTSGSERLRVDSSGNVGIGVTSMAHPLVIQNSTPIIELIDSNLSTRRAKIGGENGNVTIDIDPNQAEGTSFFSVDIDNTERFRIDSSGNVGIGRDPRVMLDVAGEAAIAYNATYGLRFYNQAQNNWSSIGNNVATGSSSATLVFKDASGEAMRLDGSSNLLVGSTNNSNETDEGFKLKPNGEGTNKPRLSISTAGYQTETCLSIYSTAVTAFRFYVDAAGTISAVNTSITSISDERVKENVRDLDDGLDKVLQLQPRKFDWKQGQGRDISNDRGFIAQEFEQVFPDMIEEWKDKAPEGEDPYKAINANLIPTLVKAIQEQQETIAALEARITQLENN